MQNMSLYSGGGQGGNGGGPGGNSAAQQQAVYAAHHGNHLVRSGQKKKRDFDTNIGTHNHVHVHMLTILGCYKMDRKLGQFCEISNLFMSSG